MLYPPELRARAGSELGRVAGLEGLLVTVVGRVGGLRGRSGGAGGSSGGLLRRLPSGLLRGLGDRLLGLGGAGCLFRSGSLGLGRLELRLFSRGFLGLPGLLALFAAL